MGVLQVAGIDPRRSPIADFRLVPVMTVSGLVDRTVAGTTFPVAVSRAAVILTDTNPLIPGRGMTVSAQSDAAGNFGVTLPQSKWNVVVRPPGSPPKLDAVLVSANVQGLELTLPALGDLTNVSGKIVLNGVGLGGVRVGAIASGGEQLGESKPTTNDGSFQLTLPPEPLQFFLQIGPDPAVPDSTVPTFSPRFYTAMTGPVDLGLIEVGPLPPDATIAGQVVDTNGSPIPKARVQVLSTDVTGWIISRQATADANGNYSILVRNGSYVLEAVPDPDPAQPALSGEVPVQVPSAVPATVVCPPKAHGLGTIVRPDGRAGGPEYQIVATRLADRLVTGRAGFTTATDTSGAFQLVGDPGRYRVEIVPTPDAGLPRTFATLELKGTGTADKPETLVPLIVAAPVELFGKVLRGAQTPVASATVEFFALESSGQRAVLIGSSLTDANGAYQVVLPDSASPAGP